MDVFWSCQNLPVVHRFCGSCFELSQNLPVVHRFCGECFGALSNSNCSSLL